MYILRHHDQPNNSAASEEEKHFCALLLGALVIQLQVTCKTTPDCGH